jgi:transposase
MHPQSVGVVPEETRRVAHAAFPKGCLCLRVRDMLRPIFIDEQFTDLFALRGRPAQAPWRLALMSVLQYVAGLSDRQAAEAVRGRIEWNYLLGLELTDAGFDHTVLCECRERLLAGSAETRLLEAILAVCHQQGWVHPRGAQRTDSTHVLMAARALNRLEAVGETLRAVLNVLAASPPTGCGSVFPLTGLTATVAGSRSIVCPKARMHDGPMLNRSVRMPGCSSCG